MTLPWQKTVRVHTGTKYWVKVETDRSLDVDHGFHCRILLDGLEVAGESAAVWEQRIDCSE
ncbi:hypothetical protein KO481_25665 [Nocardia sp. NEAU-G5]|uniref:Uncharacterized protein n=1 Tax=Nocardia albiluteola TaxID=2842303 RepID=A0ABS6B557_9NOCA|nr:hypothetical protein [Nocardia albiluteola]MBU3064905.1 hypothetical protein [Nocardia albiluteola]